MNLIPVKIQESASLMDQFEKIVEECDEAEREILFFEHHMDETIEDADKYTKLRIAMELVDIQTACETALAMLGLNEKQRDDVRVQVNEKNRARGYIE